MIKYNHNKIKFYIIVIFAAIAVAVGIIVFFNVIITKEAKESVITISAQELKNQSDEIEWFEDEFEEKLNINDIIKENLNDQEKEEIETEVVDLEYETEYQDNDNLPKGMVKVLQQGQDGKQELIIRKKYLGDKLISDEQIGRRIVTACVNKVVEVGTASSYNNQSIKIGDIVYSTPYSLAIREKAKKDAEIIISISQDSKLKIIKKSNSWYYVNYESYYGWVEDDCVTYINPNNTITSNNNNSNSTTNYSKSTLTSGLSINMNLMKPSGLTLEQFKKILSNNKQDKNKVFEQNAEYFYYIEKQYGLNGVFVAALGIHESAWGTSKIATKKKNLFGYGAYDMSAYSSAYSYNGYAASIDMIARVLVKYYLNPKGTSIYNGEVAKGQYYNGRNLAGVNKCYATDKNWKNGVYSWMKYLYNKL